MNQRVVLLLFLGVVTLLRWWWLAPQDLPPPAAYLALCGFSPSVAYFDGPAGTAMSPCSASDTGVPPRSQPV